METEHHIVETFRTTHWTEVKTSKHDGGYLSVEIDAWITDQEELTEIIEYLQGKVASLKTREEE